MKFTKHLPFILKSVAIATFFLAAFIFYDSFKVAKDFKNYVIVEKNNVDDAEFSKIAALFNEEVTREKVSHYKEYMNDEIILQTESDSVSHYYFSVLLKGKKTPTSIKRIRESVEGIYVNPFELEKGNSYYFLYADEKSDESEKIIFTHDGDLIKEGHIFNFHSSFVKVYTDQRLILHLDFDDQSHFTLKKHDDAARLNLAFNFHSSPLPFTHINTIKDNNRHLENESILNKDRKDTELKNVALEDVEITTKKKK